MTTETVFLKEFNKLSERKCGASGAVINRAGKLGFAIAVFEPQG